MIHLTRLCSTPIKYFERPPFVFGKFGQTETMTRSTRSSSLSLSLSTHPSGGSASRVSCRPRAITAYRQPYKTLNTVKHPQMTVHHKQLVRKAVLQPGPCILVDVPRLPFNTEDPSRTLWLAKISPNIPSALSYQVSTIVCSRCCTSVS